MKSQNICKFIFPQQTGRLSVSCFVLESDMDVMQSPVLLNEHRVILVVNGGGEFQFDGACFPVETGSLTFGFEGETFAVRDAGSCEYMYIQFSGLRADELFGRFYIHRQNRYFPGFDGLIPLWRESLSRASKQTVDLASESVLLYTVSRLTAGRTQQNSLISRIIQFSEEHFTNPELSVGFLAGELSYNAKYLSHLFKQKVGVCYSEYLRTLRIQYAVTLLDHGIDSVKNVALLSGFTDPFYFSAIFKKTVGISPKDYKHHLAKH